MTRAVQVLSLAICRLSLHGSVLFRCYPGATSVHCATTVQQQQQKNGGPKRVPPPPICMSPTYHFKSPLYPSACPPPIHLPIPRLVISLPAPSHQTYVSYPTPPRPIPAGHSLLAVGLELASPQLGHGNAVQSLPVLPLASEGCPSLLEFPSLLLERC